MGDLSKRSERQVASWRSIIGQTYAEWVVEEERSQLRLTAVVFPIVLGFLASVMLSAGFISWVRPYAIPVLVCGGLVLATVWYLLGRRRENLPRRIADDLWSRGFAVDELPRLRSRASAVSWARVNEVTAAQLEAAAQSRVVSDPPMRSLGRLPMVMWAAMVAGLAGVFTLVAVSGLQAAARVAAEAAVPGIQLIFLEPSLRNLVWPAALTAVLGAYALAVIVAASRGSRIYRWLATMQFPVLGLFTLLYLLPSLHSHALWVLAGGALWFTSTLLLWTPSASKVVAAADDMNQVISAAAEQRKRSASL